MIRNNSQYLSNSLTYVYQPEIGQRTKYTAFTSTVVISTANSNLDGSGTLGTLIACTNTDGTLIKSITIKALGSTTRGMIRFYTDGILSIRRILFEVEVPAVVISSVDESFSVQITTPIWLENNKELYASTENAESFAIIAEGLDISYP